MMVPVTIIHIWLHLKVRKWSPFVMPLYMHQTDIVKQLNSSANKHINPYWLFLHNSDFKTLLSLAIGTELCQKQVKFAHIMSSQSWWYQIYTNHFSFKCKWIFNHVLYNLIVGYDFYSFFLVFTSQNLIKRFEFANCRQHGYNYSMKEGSGLWR